MRLLSFRVLDSWGSGIRLKTGTRLLHPAPRPSHTRLKRYTPIVFSTVLHGFTMFFLTKVRARSARNILKPSHTRLKMIKNVYSLVEIRA